MSEWEKNSEFDSDWDFINQLDSTSAIQLDSLKVVNQNTSLLETARDTVGAQIDSVLTNLKKQEETFKDSEYIGDLSIDYTETHGDTKEDLVSFLERTNVDELFAEASQIEGRVMEGVDIGWLERSPFAPPLPGHYPNIVDPEGFSETIGSADEWPGYFQVGKWMMGENEQMPRKDYGYTMGQVSQSKIYNPYWIDENITSSWPGEPERAFILPENDPALYENYMNYALQQDKEGVYVHDQAMVDQALAYQNYLEKHTNLQNLIHDTYVLNYDMPHFILPNQPGTREQLLGDEIFPDRARSGALGYYESGKSLWDLPKFRDPEFREEYGSKSASIISPFEFHDIVERLEGVPEGSAIGKAYQDYLSSLDSADSFVSAVQALRTQDLKRYTNIRQVLDYRGKGFGEGDVSKFGGGRMAQYMGDDITSGFQTLDQYIDPNLQPTGSVDPVTGEENWFEFQEEADLRYIDKQNQELLQVLSALKELE